MGSGKHRWKISIYRSNKPEIKKEPPDEFICPISGSLMMDPVIVTSGQTFERVCVLACKTLNFTPTLRDGIVPDLSVIIPNLALKSAIHTWTTGTNFRYSAETAKPVDLNSALKLVRALIREGGFGKTEGKNNNDNNIDSSVGRAEGKNNDNGGSNNNKCVSEEMLLRKVGDNPDASNIGHAASELNRRVARFDSDEWGVSNSALATPLQFSTRPSCFSSSSSLSTTDVDVSGAGHTSEEEDELVAKMRSMQSQEQEEAVISLRRITRTGVESRVSLCTPRVLQALRSLIASKRTSVQVNALAAVVNLSLEKPNKVKIVRAGMVPPVIEVLRGSGWSPESQEHAAGALFSLALDDANKTAIGVLGALQPLIQTMTSSSESISERARQDAALALYHLSLVQSNRSKLVKFGSVPVLLTMVKTGRMTGRVLLILCNLGACSEGRAAMLDAGAVECLVGMLRVGEFEAESDRENCAAALCVLSRGGGLRFRVVAMAAGAAEVMKGVAETAGGASERAREKARRVLEALRAREDEEAEEEDIDWEKVLEAGFPSRTLSRVGGPSGNNSTGF